MMKWIGIGVTSLVMGVFLAVAAQTAYPALPDTGFLAAAIVATAFILSIMIRLTVTAATIDIRPAMDSNVAAKLK